MPYKRVKNKIYVKRTSGWKLKQTCHSVSKAKAVLRILKDLE